MVETKLRPPTEEELKLAILLGRKVVIPTIKLLIGRRFRKKSVEIRLLYGAVFTFYDPISYEDYNGIFVKRIWESKVDKNKLEVDGLTVSYSISPNVKTVFPAVLEAEYGNRILEEEEIVSMYTRIDQIRLFVYPTQEQEMRQEGLEYFAKAFDNFVERIEICLRREKKIPLNMVVKHLILESENTKFLEKASRAKANEDLRVHRSNRKVSITYIRLEKLVKFIRDLW